jgi:hypothetical protein
LKSTACVPVKKSFAELVGRNFPLARALSLTDSLLAGRGFDQLQINDDASPLAFERSPTLPAQELRPFFAVSLDTLKHLRACNLECIPGFHVAFRDAMLG